jgi:hypothetical protein
MSALNLGEIVATTLRNRNPSMGDNITNDNFLLSTLQEKGHFKSATGGRTLVEPIAYAENSSAKFYDGYETFTITEQSDQIDAAEYDWKQLGGFAMISGAEAIKNSGKYAALNLIKSRIDVLEMTLKNDAGASIYSDGTGTSGKEFGGLQLLIADDPTAAGTVGGIDQAANAFWRNQTATVSGGLTSANVTGAMNDMWLACRRGKDAVDLIPADYVAYTAYEESLQQYQRFTNNSKKAAAGFEALKYKTADVIADEQCPAGVGGGGRMYFINSDYLYMQCTPKRKFTVGKSREVTNADYTVVPVWLMGNLTMSNRARQGVIVGNIA